MNCKDAHYVIHDYIDGAIRDRDRKGFELHLADCAECVQALEHYRVLMQEMDRFEYAPVPAGLTDRVIESLRATGQIVADGVARVERAPVTRRVRSGLFGWMPPRLRTPVAVGLILLITAAILPAAIDTFRDALGKGAVLVTDTYLKVEDGLGDASVATSFFENVKKNLQTIGTVVRALFSLLAWLGSQFLLPAAGMLITLVVGVAWYLRHHHQRRTTRNASFSF